MGKKKALESGNYAVATSETSHPACRVAALEGDCMNPLKLRRFWQARRRYAMGILVCFCALGLVPATYGQTDRVSQLINQLKNPDPGIRQKAASSLGDSKDPRA